MGVLVKGMKMPNGCIDCMFCWPGDGDAYCVAQCYRKEYGTHCHKIQFDYGIGYEEQKTWREPTCPIQKVEEPHGRLIDADHVLRDCEYPEVETYTRFALESAPTVVEAEN